MLSMAPLLLYGLLLPFARSRQQDAQRDMRLRLDDQGIQLTYKKDAKHWMDWSLRWDEITGAVASRLAVQIERPGVKRTLDDVA